jgi:hypothetical protein
MKNMIKSLVVMAAMLMPLFMQAQSPLDKIYEKYATKNGFTTVNLSKDMFQLFTNMADDKDTSTVAFKKAIAQLDGMKVITCNVDSTKPALALAFYDEVAAVFPPSVYKELMTVNDDGNNVRFLTKQDAAGKIREMVMLEKGKKEVVVMNLTGIIDLTTVSKISKSMNIKGMENLKNYKEKGKK